MSNSPTYSPEVMRTAVRELRRRDRVLDRLIAKHGACKLAPNRHHYAVVVGTIISQQVSSKAADSIHKRLIATAGRRHVRPADILALDHDELRGCGLSNSKARFVKHAADYFAQQRRGPSWWARLDDREVIDELTTVKGIGEWSAHMFLMFALGRLDVFPLGDLGVRNAMIREYGLRSGASDKRLHQIGDVWRPYRSIGSMYMWASYD